MSTRKILPTYELGLKLQMLRSLKSHLRPSGQNFADSLLRQSKTGLSEKQWESVDKLIQEAEELRVHGSITPIRQPQQIAREEGLEGIHALFAKAKAESRVNPKIKFEIGGEEGEEAEVIRLTAHRNGLVYVNIESKGRDIEEWSTLGHIDKNGKWVEQVFKKIERPESLFPAIRELIADPSKFGSVYGRRLKYCIFCGSELTSEDSLYYGYGPICAEKYELEWGEARERKTEEAAEEVRRFLAEEIIEEKKPDATVDTTSWFFR